MPPAATPIADPTTFKPPRRRRWIPLSLRFFGVMLGILSVAGACFVIPSYRRHMAIEEIERSEGDITLEPRVPKLLQKWVGGQSMNIFDNAIAVNLYHDQARESMMRQVGRLSTLQRISLDSTNVSDVGLAHLSSLSGVTELYLNNTAVTDIGLQFLKGMSQLKKLELDNTPTSDRGLAELRGLVNLESLWLGNTNVTDAGLIHLRGMTRLKLLWLDKTRVTHAGVSELQRSLPGLVVRYNGGFH